MPALIIGGAVTNVAMYGSDQVIVQRCLTTSSKTEMAKAVMFNGTVTLPVMGMLWLAGTGLPLTTPSTRPWPPR